MAITASFSSFLAELSVFGDSNSNSLIVRRAAPGAPDLQALTGASLVPIQGGSPTIDNTFAIDISGNLGDDQIALVESNGVLPLATVFAGGGNDEVFAGSGSDNLFGGDGDDFLEGRGGDDIIHGGAGIDQVSGGDGNDRVIWNYGDGRDRVDGGSGVDTLVINDAADGNFVSIVPDAGRIRIGVNQATVLESNGVERIQINAIGGQDYVRVFDLSGTGVGEIAIDLAGAPGGGTGDGAHDAVAMDGTNGNDDIRVTPVASGVTVNGLPALRTVDRPDASDELLVSGFGGNDRIDASGLGAHVVVVSLDGGAGDDTLSGGPAGDTLNGGDNDDLVVGSGGDDTAALGGGNDLFVWTPGDGDDSIEGDLGTDTVQFVGANADERIDVSTGGLLAPPVLLTRDIDHARISAHGVERFDVAALGGADTITVGDLAGLEADLITIDLAGALNGTTGDGARDRVYVNGDESGDGVTVVSLGSVVSVDRVSD